MTKTIPARTETTCDVCNRTCDLNNRRKSGIVNVGCNGLDYQGMAVGPGGFRLEVCDECLGYINDAIDSCVQSIKEDGK
jgi:hypothetical protein